LQVRHVDFLRRHLTVEQQVQQTAGQAVYVCPPKTQSSYRVVPLPQTVVDALANHLRGRGAGPNDFIFTAPSGGPVVRTSFMHSTWAPAAKAAGLAKGVGLHSLRHFYASALIRGGLSVKVVSERLGHANAAMTLNVYAHLWPDDEDRTRQAVDDLFGVSVEPRVASTLKLSESLSVAGKDRSTLRAAR
jgi:integrase